MSDLERRVDKVTQWANGSVKVEDVLRKFHAEMARGNYTDFKWLDRLIPSLSPADITVLDMYAKEYWRTAAAKLTPKELAEVEMQAEKFQRESAAEPPSDRD